MAQPDEQMRVLEEWLQLPESRRRHATDIVAFAYRLLRERPELLVSTAHVDDLADGLARDQGGSLADSLAGNPVSCDLEASLARIVSWLLPHLNIMKLG